MPFSGISWLPRGVGTRKQKSGFYEVFSQDRNLTGGGAHRLCCVLRSIRHNPLWFAGP